MKKFLTTFSALAAAFGANATANALAVAPEAGSARDLVHVSDSAHQPSADGRISINDEAGNTFNFVLKPAGANGQMMAYHESHSSHSSHRSHASHYSSRY